MRNLYFIINLLRYLSSCGHSWLLSFFWNSLFLWLLACIIPHSPGFLLMSLAVFSISWPGSPLLQTVVWNSPKISFGVSSRYVLYWDQFRIDYHHVWAWGLRLNYILRSEEDTEQFLLFIIWWTHNLSLRENQSYILGIKGKVNIYLGFVLFCFV